MHPCCVDGWRGRRDHLTMRCLLLVTLGLVSACTPKAAGDDHQPGKGDEGGPCKEGGTCNGTLSCRSSVCVDLDMGGSGGAGLGGTTRGAGGTGGAASGGRLGTGGAASGGGLGTGGTRATGGSPETGGGGSAVLTVPADAGPACRSLGQTCDPVACCAGTTCYNSGISTSCAQVCSDYALCPGGCCVPLTNGSNACLPGGSCPCAQPNESCTTRGCCAGAVCVSGTCAALCTSSSNCASGCCALLDTGKRACAAPSFCLDPCELYTICLNTPDPSNPQPTFTGRPDDSSGCDSGRFADLQSGLCANKVGLSSSQVLACVQGSSWCSLWSKYIRTCDEYCLQNGLVGTTYHKSATGSHVTYCASS